MSRSHNTRRESNRGVSAKRFKVEAHGRMRAAERQARHRQGDAPTRMREVSDPYDNPKFD